MAVYTERVVDGQTVLVPSFVGSAEWVNIFERFMEDSAALMAARDDFKYGFADPLNDDSDITYTNGSMGTSYIQNTTQSGNLLPEYMTSNSQDGFTLTASNQYTPAYYACDGNAGTCWYNNITQPAYFQVAMPEAVEVVGYAITAGNISTTHARAAGDAWTFQGSTDGSYWVDLDSRSGMDSEWSAGERKEFALNEPVSGCLYFRTYNVTTCQDPSYPGEVQYAGFEILTNPSVNSMTVVTDYWIPDSSYSISINDIDEVKAKIWVENLDDNMAMSVGSSSSDLVRAYLGYGTDGTFSTTAIEFTDEPEETYEGSNIFVHTSDSVPIDTTGTTALSMMVQSYSVGSAAPNWKLHGMMLVGKESD